MQPDSAGAPHYIPGDHWTVCDRCSRKIRRSQQAKEWTGLVVCRDGCLDPVPPEMSPPRAWPEGLPVQDARPVPPYIFIDTDIPPDPGSL
jgi:hypothetical protein